MDTSLIPKITLERAQELAQKDCLNGLFWMSDSDYHNSLCPGVSSTRLKQILRSPLHYRQAISDPEETAAMVFGRLVHEMLFQPEVFTDHYTRAVENPHDWNKERKAYLDWRLKRIEECGPKMELAEETWDQLYGIVDAVWNAPTAERLLNGGVYELTAFTKDPDTGLIIRVKVDCLNGWHITDLKTCQDARPEAFVRDARKYMYPLSAAMYLDVMNAEGPAFGLPLIDSFLWIAVEKKRPHGVWCHAATPPLLDLGRKQYKEALKLLKDCTDNEAWPGYPEEITPLEFSQYQLKELYE